MKHHQYLAMIAALVVLTPLAQAAAPVVSNIAAVQRAGTQLVDITYNVTADSPTVSVTLAISSDNGTTFSVPATTVSGAVGVGVATGTGKSITWNAGVDWSKQYSTTMCFKVTANDLIAPAGFSLIPAGSFQMGNAMASDTDITDAPIRTVTISAFFMAQNLITLSDWSTVRTWGLTHGYTDLAVGAGKAATHPVQTITWYDMVKWCNARSEKEGLTPCYMVSAAVYRTTNSDAVGCNWAANGYRLPSEAEWEKAARGGLSGKRFPWGDTISQSQANYYGSTSYSYDLGPNGYNSIGSVGGTSPATSPAGSFAANGYGLYDMAGNVWEWCWDWYNTYAAGSQTDPHGVASGSGRVIRGGGWNGSAVGCRVAGRNTYTPPYGDSSIGFRVVLSSPSAVAGSGFAITSNVTVDTRSAVSSLSGLVLSSGSLSPSFAAATKVYSSSVTNATSSITVTPSVTDTTAVVKVNGTTLSSGTASGAIPLAAGTNTITIQVMAQDGITTSTYTVTVTRPPSAVSTLAGLVLSSGALSPAFASGTLAYTSSVANAITAMTVTCTVTDATATIKVNGVSATSGTACPSIPLVVGTNPITVLVTAQDGTTASTYTVTVNRISTVSTLSGLVLSSGTLSPAFSTGTLAYAASVPNATSSATVTPTVSDATATVKVNGTTVTSGSASSAIPLVVGNNTLTVLVTAQDGTTTSTYTITVNRTSTVSSLSGLVMSSGTLSPTFVSGTKVYTASVANAITALTVTPTLTNSYAAVTVNGISVSSGAASASIPLVVGTNLISVLVTAQDGTTTSTYTVTVTRISTVSTLSGLALSAGTLSPVFGTGTLAYTASVPNATSTMTVTPTVTDGTATVKVNGTTVASGSASAAVPLVVGNNTITVLVTAQDGSTTSTYTITVNRISTVSTLAGLAINSGTLSPTFVSGTKVYTASMANAITALTVTPTLTNSYAAVTVNGMPVTSGTASQSIPLVVGTNLISVLVTAQDGTTTSTYSITVTRISTISTLAGLALSAGTLSPVFGTGTLAYTASVPNPISAMTVTPTVTDATATVKVNGTTVGPGSASGSIPVLIGNSLITVLVTAQDGTTTSSYTITVTRPPLAATFTAASSVGVSASGYTATGGTVSLTLGFAPPTGTNLTVVDHAGLNFITGRFSNLAQGQMVPLSYNNVTYPYIANYYGGTGNDLVLQWPYVQAYAWGMNGSGQLGNAGAVSGLIPGAVSSAGILSGKAITSMAAGATHSLALCMDGTVAAWGGNGSGQLGNGTILSGNTPVAVSTSGALSGKTVIALAAGASHSLALSSDGSMAAWGDNSNGQLGNNSTTGSSAPVAVNTSGVLAGKTVVTIATGAFHSLALCSDGTLASWGYNADGELGNNSTANSSVPVRVTAAGALIGKTVVVIAAGYYHSLALCSDGTLVTWGFNGSGQLGNNSAISSSVPVVVSSTGSLIGKTIASIAAGGSHTLTLCTDGTLESWGDNGYGQLGIGSNAGSRVPVTVYAGGALAGQTVSQVRAGYGHSLALCADGTLVSWGYNQDGELGNNSNSSTQVPTTVPLSPLGSGTKILALAQGPTANHALASVAVPLSTNSALSGLALSAGSLSPVFAPGTISYNASVLGSTASLTLTPVTASAYATVKVNGAPLASGSASQVIPLAAGNNTINVVITAENGTSTTTYAVTVFRPSSDATLSGLTLNEGSLSPVFSSGTTNYAASVVYSTSSVTIRPVTNHAGAALTVNGTPLVSGASSTPIPLILGSNAIQVKVTAQDGTTITNYTITVTRPPLDATFTAASSVAVTSAGYTATGNSVSLALGYAPSTGTNLTVINNTGIGFISGRFDNLAQGQSVQLSYNGVIYRYIANYYGGTGNDLVLQWANTRACGWGYNAQSQLGNASTANSSVPVAVLGTGALAGKTVVALADSFYHSLALCSDGSVAAWGNNTYGQLGNNSLTSSNVPVLVSTSGVLSGKTVVAISSGLYFSVALCSDGTLASWGNNAEGELGNNSLTNSSVPVAVNTAAVLSGKTVVAIAAGFNHCLALCSDGTVAAWGYNGFGELGNGSGTNSSVPVLVSSAGVLSGKTVTALAGGQYHSLALCADGSVAAWGYNGYGQLGNNNGTTSSVPVAVTSSGVLSGKPVTAIAAGANHSLGLCADGSVAAWGQGKYGQLGNNSLTGSTVPVAVTGSGVLNGKAVTTLSAGQYHSIAQCADGSVAAWGYNNVGQLGNNSLTYSGVPVAVSTTALGRGCRLVAAACGASAYHALALLPVSADSRLSGLVVGTGALYPAFSSSVSAYTSSISNAITSATVTPTCADLAASVTVNGVAVPPGSASAAISLGASSVNILTVVVTAQDGTTSSSYTVTIDNTPYGIWKKATFTNPAAWNDPAVIGELATPAHDGITNLMKYAMALSPMAGGTGNLPTSSRQAGYLTLTYRKSKTASDVTYTVQAADSLGSGAWTPAATVLSQTDQGAYWLVTVRDNVPYATHPQRYMRLQVVK
ncbi:MAG: cadherin-like beta sandwich domain-containing protein [Verrucomicrobiota bacterium]